MALSGGQGMLLDLRKVPCENLIRDDSLLFSESNSRFLLEVPNRSKEDFEELMRGVAYADIGEVTTSQRLVIRGLKETVLVETALSDLRKSWKEKLGSWI
jgi:phosphoribosylformylglycinamidine synthase